MARKAKNINNRPPSMVTKCEYDDEQGRLSPTIRPNQFLTSFDRKHIGQEASTDDGHHGADGMAGDGTQRDTIYILHVEPHIISMDQEKILCLALVPGRRPRQ